MGVVYEAIQEKLNRTVALKVLSPIFSQNKKSIERFKRESEAAAKLQYPGIVQVYDAGNEDDTYYYAMEYVKGRALMIY